jgi:hypothetical protein
MGGYYWSWRDDDSVYVNHSKTLAEIIEEVLYYYGEDGDLLLEDSDVLRFCFNIKDCSHRFEIEKNCADATRALNEIARIYGRDDMFAIMESA